MSNVLERRVKVAPTISGGVIYDGKKMREDNETSSKHQGVNYSATLIDFIAQDSVNMLDHLPISGFPESKTLADNLYVWDFDTFKSKVGKYLSMFGSQFVYVLNDGTPANPYNIYTGIAYVNRGKSIMYPDEVIISNNYYDRLENGNVSKHGAIRIWKEDGVVKYDVGYWDKKVSEFTRRSENAATFTFHGMTEIPGKFIRNTSTSTSDWERVADIMKEVDTLIDDVPIEWEWIKTQLSVNNNYGGGDQSINTLTGKISSGGRIHKADNIDSTLAIPNGIFVSGSTTLADLIGMVNWYEDKIMKMSFTNRDASSGGNNKHTTEVTLFNQTASQYLKTKKLQRERDWTRFFKDVVFPLFGINGDDLSLVFSISEYEQGKLDLSAATVRELNARAYQYEQKGKYEGQNAMNKANPTTPSPANNKE